MIHTRLYLLHPSIIFLCSKKTLFYYIIILYISLALNLLIHIDIGGFWRDRLWENYTASSVYPGRGNIISTRCWLQHNLHSTPSYICHICCSANIFWKRRKPWWNCWLPNSSGVKTLVSNKIAILHYRSFTSAAGNTFSETRVCFFYIWCFSDHWSTFPIPFDMHLCIIKRSSIFFCTFNIQSLVKFDDLFMLVSFDLKNY